MFDRLIGVKSVDVQKVDRFSIEVPCSAVEIRSHQPRETPIFGIVIICKPSQDAFVKDSSVFVTAPMVNAKSLRRVAKPIDRLAERAIGNTLVHAQFDKHSRAERINDPESKRNVFIPRRDGEPVRPPERWNSYPARQ